MQRISYSIPCPALKTCHITQAKGCVVHHEPVPALHTSLIVFIGENNHPIRLFQNSTVCLLILWRPFVRLGRTRDCNCKLHFRKALAKLKHLLCRNRVKAPGTAAQKGPVAVFVCTGDSGPGLLPDLPDNLLRYCPVSRKACCLFTNERFFF